MEVPRTKNWLTIGLYLNAVLLVGVIIALLSRDGAPQFLPAAFGQQAPQPIAGGGGIFLMPGQLSANSYGCYVMDVDQQTLMVYEYRPGDRKLRFMAGRDFSSDRKIHNLNTEPSPAEVKQMVDLEQNKTRQDSPDK